MNTTTFTHRTATAAACIAAIIAGATACGTEDGASASRTAAAARPAPTSQSPHATPSPRPAPDTIEAQMAANREAYIHRMQRHARYHDAATRQHPSGFDKAINAER